ncbi:MAG: hypothetical protein DMD76_08925 [Candidatus Rokuibacteriota bacterium]|nr:MAG: hypothetical protein DMD76_08925 [Candidatus Rokubacteria bacterium]
MRSPCLISSMSTSRASGLRSSVRYFSQYFGECASVRIWSRASVSAARSPFFAASRNSPRIFWPLIRDGAVFAIGAGCYHEGPPRKRPQRGYCIYCELRRLRTILVGRTKNSAKAADQHDARRRLPLLPSLHRVSWCAVVNAGLTVASALCGLLAAACASHQAGPAAARTAQGAKLLGTAWRLVEFQSPDDRIGTVRPKNPAAYTMALEPDGRVALRLNCNRGAGAWSATATGPDAGSFRLGPLAVTKAFCPPPSLDVQFARDAEYIRSYVLRDGRLYLHLMADGGTYVWEPARGAR